MTCQRKGFNFSLLNTGSQGHSQSVQGQTTELLLIFHFFPSSGRTFLQTAWKSQVWVALPGTSAQARGWGCEVTVSPASSREKYQEHWLLCTLTGHTFYTLIHWAREASVSWKHLTGLSIFSSWILRLTVFKVGGCFPFSHTPPWREEAVQEKPATLTHTHVFRMGWTSHFKGFIFH